MAPELTFPNGRRLTLDRPRIMGVLNVTPDSFSDGGRWLDPAEATRHGIAMAVAGADVIDIGGESTRPGSDAVTAPDQVRRVLPVIERLRPALDREHPGVVISIDTASAEVAAVALTAGAEIINDVSAGQSDPHMLRLAATRSAPIVLMHMRGTPRTMQENPCYDDVVGEVVSFLSRQVDAAVDAGVERTRILVDPGIGFGKTREHNLSLLAGLDRLLALGQPVLVGTSRKRFMGSICQDHSGRAPAPHDLVGATCATTALGVAAGVRMFRVHDVAANRQAADVAWALSGRS